MMNNFNRFKGKVAFIQGGSRGIGAAIVERLALEGASVAFTFVSSHGKAKALAESLTSQDGKVIAIKADSTKPEDIRNAISETIEQLGQIDIVKDPVVIASEGGKLFTKESLKAIKRWRYAPKFVDGQPVAAEATVQLEYSLSP